MIVENSEPDEGIHIKIKDLPFTIKEVLAKIEGNIEWENGGRRAVIFNAEFDQVTEIEIDENSIFELTKLSVEWGISLCQLYLINFMWFFLYTS